MNSVCCLSSEIRITPTHLVESVLNKFHLCGFWCHYSPTDFFVPLLQQFYCLVNKELLLSFFFLFCFLFFVFCLFRSSPSAGGSSQARGRIRATAAGLRHSHSHPGFEPRLWPTPQLTATPDPKPTEQGQGWTLHPHGYSSDSFTTEPPRELQELILYSSFFTACYSFTNNYYREFPSWRSG